MIMIVAIIISVMGVLLFAVLALMLLVSIMIVKPAWM